MFDIQNKLVVPNAPKPSKRVLNLVHFMIIYYAVAQGVITGPKASGIDHVQQK